MSEPSLPPEPDFDALLAPAAAAFPRGLREGLLERTLGQVRFRRRLRRITSLAALALAFAAGLLVRTWTGSPPAPEVGVVPTRPEEPKSPPHRLSPAELERQAESIFVPAESARRFREAGDGYLAEFGDLRGALRCYRNFLDEADQADLAQSDSDTWLLASLKKERLKENNDADGAN
jgi:hypothetical protein